jgi:hypothetical protein
MNQNPKGLISTMILSGLFLPRTQGQSARKGLIQKPKTTHPNTVQTELKCYSQLGLVKPYTNLVRRHQQQ